VVSVAVAITAVDRDLVLAFASVLDYPRAAVGVEARACVEVARPVSEEAAGLVARFGAFAETATLGELQEAYTIAFDLDSLSEAEPTCYPYVGHHLFDENHKRSAFILGLRKRYREHGFEESGELPDHLVVLLRFLAVCPDEELGAELVDDAILPALETMLGPSDPAEAPTPRNLYRGVVKALALALAAGRPAREADEEAEAAARAWERHGDSLGIDRERCSH
jgi:nitrate reductase delta subunit